MSNISRHSRVLPALGVIALVVSPLCLAVSRPSTTKDSPSMTMLEGRAWRIGHPSEDQLQTWPHRGLLRRVEPYIRLHGDIIDGSTGCGTLVGTYHGSGRRLSVAVRWIEPSSMNCDDEDRNDASQIVTALNRVQNIAAKPEYWQEDAFLLTDAKNQTQLVLSPMKTGDDLSDLTDTFWSLSKLDGAESQVTDAIIWIQLRAITFSSPSCFFSNPFSYELRGLEFYPAWERETDDKNPQLADDQRIAADFEHALHRITSYRVEGDTLFLSTGEQPSFVVLSRIHPTGIEARRWRIAYYGSSRPGQKDSLNTAKEFAEVTFIHGRVHGSPGCGGWVGSYSLRHDRLTVKADYALAGLCSSSELAQAALVVKALNGDLHVAQEENRTLLRKSDGLVSIVLVPF